MKKLLVVVAGVVAGLTTAGIVMATRNTAGTYTYPGGTYPVTGGTAITSTWANSIFGDIQTNLTNSLDRNGNGGMLASLRVPDGTAGIPALSWTNETGTGLYRSGTADLRLSIAGTARWHWTSTGAGAYDPASGNTAYLVAPSGLAADETLTLPAALPGSTAPMFLSASGQVTASSSTQIVRSNLPTVGQQVSGSSGTFSSSSSLIDVTNLTVTITTTGRPVVVQMQPDGNTTIGARVYGAGGNPQLALVRDGTTIALFAGFAGGNNTPGSSFLFLDTAAGAGSHTYKIQSQGGGGNNLVYYCALAAYEL
jgi:hypothetical protein